MPGWFDLYDWPIGIEARDDRDGLERSVRQIRETVRKLELESGIPRNRILLGGFSQGGAVAMLATYTDLGDTENGDTGKSSTPYAGCVTLSGWLPLRDSLVVSPGAQQTPLFWAHGSYDDKVLFEQQTSGVKVLKEKGVKSVQHSQYAMGHSSTQDELEAMAEFLDSVLFPQHSSQL
jgi:lysophospholipase-2